MSLPKEKERFTYQDYLTWPDDERWELIEGIPYNMTPAPTLRHQRIIGRFHTMIDIALEGKSCVPFTAPADVVFSESDVVQPDLFVVCDRSKTTGANLQGAPDLVIEALSPSTTKKDQREKKQLYERYGVREYIIVDPEGQFVNRFFLGEDGQYDRGEILDANETLVLKSLPDVEIALSNVFETEPKQSSPPQT